MKQGKLETCDSNRKSRKSRMAYFFVAPFLLLCSLEVMHLCYPSAAYVFFRSEFFWLKWLVTYGFLLCWQGFFYAIFQNALVANILNSSLMFMIAYTSEVMGRLNGNPLIPSNLLMVGNLGEITTFVKIPFFPAMISAIAFILLSWYLHGRVLYKHPVKRKWYQHLAFTLTAIVAFVTVNNAICINKKSRYQVLPRMDVHISAFNPIEDYQANGAMLTFFPRIGDLIVPKPKTYSKASLQKFQSEYEAKIPEPGKTKANVIIIQNESWWDPALMPGVTYNTDLIGGIRSLSENTVKGTFLSPVYSGGTCMPEFEVITGIPTYLLPSAAYPYSQYITEPTASIVSAYREQGYQTVALHPYKTNFYNRSTAYPFLGFETFKGVDDFSYQDISGTYIDDMACVKQIIEEFEQKTSDYIFEFVVTMENHGTYKQPRYPSFDITMDAPDLTSEDYDDLLRYSQGVYNADKAYMALVDYFSKVEEPVILVMYGDHLPLLGTNGSTYMDAGFVEHTDTFSSGNYPKLYETPYVVWTNYDIPDFNLPPKISGNTLGLKIFMQSGLKAPWYLMTLDEFSNRYPATVNTAIYNAEMENVDKLSPEDAELMEQMDLLMYDLLHGHQYCTKK